VGWLGFQEGKGGGWGGVAVARTKTPGPLRGRWRGVGVACVGDTGTKIAKIVRLPAIFAGRRTILVIFKPPFVRSQTPPPPKPPPDRPRRPPRFPPTQTQGQTSRASTPPTAGFPAPQHDTSKHTLVPCHNSEPLLAFGYTG
jgi:hypothetical protein